MILIAAWLSLMISFYMAIEQEEYELSGIFLVVSVMFILVGVLINWRI